MIQFIYQSNISIIVFSFLERYAFKLSRIIAILPWIFYILARPAANRLDYDSLIEMASAYPTVPKLNLKQVQQQQRKWSDRTLHIALFNNCKKILEVGCGRGYPRRPN